jgi:hypothetical protein
MRGVALVLALTTCFGWVVQTTLGGYNVAFSTLTSRMDAIDGDLVRLQDSMQAMDARSTMDHGLIKSELGAIKQIVMDGADRMREQRSELNHIRVSLQDNRENTAQIRAIVEQQLVNITQPAAGPETP